MLGGGGRDGVSAGSALQLRHWRCHSEASVPASMPCFGDMTCCCSCSTCTRLVVAASSLLHVAQLPGLAGLQPFVHSGLVVSPAAA